MSKKQQHWARIYSDKECTEANERDCIPYEGAFKQDPQSIVDHYLLKLGRHGVDDWQAIRFDHANGKDSYKVYKPDVPPYKSTLYIFHDNKHPNLASAFAGYTLNEYSFADIDRTLFEDKTEETRRIEILLSIVTTLDDRNYKYATVVYNPTVQSILTMGFILDPTDYALETTPASVGTIADYYHASMGYLTYLDLLDDAHAAGMDVYAKHSRGISGPNHGHLMQAYKTSRDETAAAVTRVIDNTMAQFARTFKRSM